MQEVVCFNCGRIVHISPDAELCSVCGENLRELIHPAFASRYFYDRAARLAAGTELLQALREVDRGLTYEPTSELRLLGAILSQRIGDFEQMRRHVAAVPVDDILRPEAEWLLRSHQERQRDARTAYRSSITPLPAQEDVPFFEEEQTWSAPLAASAPRATPQRVAPTRRNLGQISAGVALILLLVAVITTVVSLSGRGWSPILPWSSTANRGTDEIDTPAIVAPAQPTDVAPQDAPLLMPTVTPGVDIPNDVVQILEPEPVAQGTLSAFVVNPLQPFDLDTYLQENGRPDLAGLGVAASSKEGVLLLDGIVPAYQVRQDLIDLMESAPGVNRVSGANLLVRWPPTYTVAEGDTLWAISYYLYGEDHVAELLAANRAVLPASNMLTIGMELNIPEIEQ